MAQELEEGNEEKENKEENKIIVNEVASAHKSIKDIEALKTSSVVIQARDDNML